MGKTLDNATEEELLQAIDNIKAKKKKESKPWVKLGDYPEQSKRLNKTVQYAINEIHEKGYSKDHARYVYEAAMEACCGPSVWKWKNEYDKGE